MTAIATTSCSRAPLLQVHFGHSTCAVALVCILRFACACVAAGIPKGCLRWYDGCNTCSHGEDGRWACTELFCLVYKRPYCIDDEGAVAEFVSLLTICLPFGVFESVSAGCRSPNTTVLIPAPSVLPAPAGYGGSGIKGRAAVSAERPIVAASCREQSIQVSCQAPHPTPPCSTRPFPPLTQPTAPTALPNTHHGVEPPAPTQQRSTPATTHTRARHAWLRGHEGEGRGFLLRSPKEGLSVGTWRRKIVMCPRRGNDPASGHPRAHQPPLGRGTSPPAWDGRLDAPGQRRRYLPSFAWTQRREVK